jgi:hypothetical protein
VHFERGMRLTLVTSFKHIPDTTIYHFKALQNVWYILERNLHNLYSELQNVLSALSKQLLEKNLMHVPFLH